MKITPLQNISLVENWRGIPLAEVRIFGSPERTVIGFNAIVAYNDPVMHSVLFSEILHFDYPIFVRLVQIG